VVGMQVLHGLLCRDLSHQSLVVIGRSRYVQGRLIESVSGNRHSMY
jgi:hypothetical protein